MYTCHYNKILLTYLLTYNAEQLINTPTHFTEHSSSLIDLMFIKNSQHVLSSFVSDPFIPDLTRHCPVVCVLKFTKQKKTIFPRKIWLYDQGDYPYTDATLPRSTGTQSLMIQTLMLLPKISLVQL